MRGRGYPTTLQHAFRGRPELRKRLCDAIDQSHALFDLVNDVSEYVLELEQGSLEQKSILPAGKKRKLDELGSQTVADTAGPKSNGWANGKPFFSATDISFWVPQRKKFRLEVVRSDRAADGGIRAKNDGTGAAEFELSWADIDQVFSLPAPEKTARQQTYVVIPTQGDSSSSALVEPIVWSVPETAPKTVTLGAKDDGSETYVSAISRALEAGLASINKRLVLPTASEFASSIEQSHRKGERAWHVKAFRGTKDGYLFFLSPGILWAFKKPLLFFSFENITSVSYTSVLQRTFNLNITIAEGNEIEFSMVDQADFAGIDAYVKRHGLHDASMAEQRRAKILNINGTSDTKVENGTKSAEDDLHDDETELQRAERMLDDAEDELEEDYDPGSEGDSEGSGTDSDEDGQDAEDYDNQGDGDVDLVAEELGSEAGEVESDER